MAHIRDSDLERYLRVFHDTYFETASDVLPKDLSDELLRSTLYESAAIRACISTHARGGVGWEYTAEPGGEVSVTHGSAPIENLFFGYPPALARHPFTFFRAAGPLTLGGGVWRNGRLFELQPGAFVKFHDLILQTGRWERAVRYAEISTDRTQEFWSELNAVSRAKDELLIAVVDRMRIEESQPISLNEYLRRKKESQVLVCGDYNAGAERLDEITHLVAEAGYEPIRLDEVNEFPEYDLRQKFEAVAPLMRFIVIDDSSPAGQIAEVVLAERGRWVTLVLRMSGSTSSFMTRGASATSTAIREMEYSEDELGETLSSGLDWAEKTRAQLGAARDATFPWRTPPEMLTELHERPDEDNGAPAEA
ncbi:MAG TPA: hypothetical protein VFA08_01930 [Actinomycetota bacterium]|jgi:hypothetical protein|nr:hypothetical protein [Actinomycetota bacterium]